MKTLAELSTATITLVVMGLTAAIAAWMLGFAVIQSERRATQAARRSLDDVCALVSTASRSSADLTDRFLGEQIRKVVQPALDRCGRR